MASYGIMTVTKTVKNLRANVVERIHLTIGDMIRTEKYAIEDAWRGEVDTMLSTCDW